MNRFIRSGIYVFLASVVVGELLALSVPAKAPYLERINADPNGAWYINKKTMVNPSSDRISFWSTAVPMKGGDSFAWLGMVLKNARKNPLRLEYVQTLQEADCSTRKISAPNILFSDKQDRIVHTINAPLSAQQPAVIGHVEDRLLAAV